MHRVLEAALDLLLEKQARAGAQVMRQRTAIRTAALPASGDLTAEAVRTSEPESSCVAQQTHRRAGPREQIPAAVRRAVWERDGGSCAWQLDAGGCCGSTSRLELDHVVPWASGGTATVEGVRLLCHHHNRPAARLAFGERCMSRYTRGPRRQARRHHSGRLTPVLRPDAHELSPTSPPPPLPSPTASRTYALDAM